MGEFCKLVVEEGCDPQQIKDHQDDTILVRERCSNLINRRAKALGLKVKKEWRRSKRDGTAYVCFHVSGPRANVSDDWFCFSIVLTWPDYKLGVWTRKSMEYQKGPVDCVEQNRIFEPISFDQWLEGWFEKSTLEELTRPTTTGQL